MLTQYFRDLRLEDLVVVSPDAGRVKLAKKFAAKIGAELAILNKERPAQQVAEIGYVIGDVDGQDRGARRRHDRHRRHAQGRRPDRRSTRAPRASSPPPPTRCSSGNAFENLAPRPASSRSWSRTRSRSAPARRTTSGPLVRRPAHGLDPPHLHRRLGVRGVRRREPAVLSCARRLCRSCSASSDERAAGRARRRPARRWSRGDLDHRPELPILLDLLAEAEEQAGRAGAAALGAAPRARRGGRSTRCSRATSAASRMRSATLAERGFIAARRWR